MFKNFKFDEIHNHSLILKENLIKMDNNKNKIYF